MTGEAIRMRSSRRATLAATTLTAGALVAGMGGAAAAGSGDLASGSALNQFPTPAGPGFTRLSVAAHSNAGGLDPRGNVHAKGTTGTPMGAFEVHGPVTCLRVDGNRAAIKYRFSRATGSAAPFLGGGVEVFVEDNGEPRGGQPVDANAFRPPEPAAAFDTNAAQCDDPNSATYDTVTSGNYVVRGSAVGP
jgi:hypothetical protein